MRKILFIAFGLLVLVSCKQNKNTFSVSGKIEHSNGKMAYLEEVPVGTMRPVLVDSAKLEKDGSFSLKTPMGESAIYNVRMDDQMYPVASVINDQPSVQLDIQMSKENNQFAEKYEVRGSPASKSMKDFMTHFNNKLQEIFINSKALDSLRKAISPDSLINEKSQAIARTGKEIKTYTLQEIEKSANPALTMFELGYYQSTANNPGFGLEALANEEVTAIIDNVLKKNPDHTGIAALKQNLASMASRTGSGNWVGKQAPDFTLPDVNGKPFSLSSLKGKYVLVDFWASWCKPCRMENPNVVAAYHKYKNKNFTILGVSLDENKEAWTGAIRKDQLAWNQVSDLKYWDSMVIPLYQFDGIPYNVLVDPQGKVVAESLRGPELDAKLDEVLK
jgi:peroxiredoxin